MRRVTLAGDVRYKELANESAVPMRMLRITVHNDAKAPTIKLEGKIVGPWVEVFSDCWRSLAPSLGMGKLWLDLRGVSFVDSAGRQLLRDIYRETHAGFLADTPLTQYFADSAMQCSSSFEEKGA